MAFYVPFLASIWAEGGEASSSLPKEHRRPFLVSTLALPVQHISTRSS